ncbi:MAG: hypothetical protein SGPRY_003963 [Prymnesium sp.]
MLIVAKRRNNAKRNKEKQKGGSSNNNKKKTRCNSSSKKKNDDKSPDGLCYYCWARKQVNKDKDGCDKESKECKNEHAFKNEEERKWAENKWG